MVCILNWHHNSKDKIWVTLEKSLAGRNLGGAPWIPKVAIGLSTWTSLFTLATLQVWDQVNREGTFSPLIFSLALLGGVPWFVPGEDMNEGWRH